jgi:putative flippase GtrA
VVDHRRDVTDALDTTDAAAALVEEAALADGVAARGLLPRLLALRHEVGKFATVGAIAYACDVGIYNVLLRLRLETLTAAAVATVVAASVAFIGNRFWTWRRRLRSGLRREYALYFVVTLIGLLIGLSCLGISHYGLGSFWPPARSVLADNIAKNIIGMAGGTIFRFWAYRQHVFREIAADAA